MIIDLSAQECEKAFEAIVRLKFDDDDDVPGPYFASPFVSSALAKMFSALMEEAETSGDRRSVDAWLKWRNWKNRSHERRILVRRAASWGPWDGWSDGERADVLRYGAAPFLLSDSDVDDLIAEIDAVRN
ncbi:hypothetical protein GCM10027063_50520 [Promicromonospora xylanilytica]